jgi:hypothetical protein
VRLGQRESREDWLDLGRDLTRRGLRNPWLVVSDGAPGLISAIEEVWPQADRGRCAVHKLRNLLAKLPKRHTELREQVKRTYWAALERMRPTRPMPSVGCACWLANWSVAIRVPLPAWRCALRRIRTAGTAESERSVRREAYGGFGDAEWVGATVACGSVSMIDVKSVG